MIYKKTIYFNGSYLKLDQQKQILGDSFNIVNTSHIGETEYKKFFFYWIWYIFKNIIENLFSKNRWNSDIQVFNSIAGCLFYSKKKKNILIVHNYDIGINTEYIIKNNTSLIKKSLLKSINFFLGGFVKNRIKKFDYVFASTLDRYHYIKNNIRNDVEYLPNIIEDSKHRKKIYTKINSVLCPERIDLNKGLDIRKKILIEIVKNNPKTKISLLERGADIQEFKSWIIDNELSVEWIPFLSKEELYKKILSSDLVVGIFNNGALSITNLEVMKLGVPIITYDKWGRLKIKQRDIMNYTYKILNDADFRKNEAKLNYEYVSNFHSIENYKKIFTSVL